MTLLDSNITNMQMKNWITRFVCLVTMLSVVNSTVTVDILWNKTNEIFQTENILELALKDKIKFYCPVDSTMNAPPKGYYIIYRVPKIYYDNCSLPFNVENHKLKLFGINRVVTCKDPSRSKVFSVVLDQFSALPGSHGGLTFQPGQTYYFISTSTGTIEGLENRKSKYSSCLNDQMKLKLIVSHSNQVDKAVMRQYPTPKRRTTPTTKIVHSPQVVTPTVHVRRHNSKAQLPNARPPLPDYSIAKDQTTTVFKKQKLPLAIIDAAVTLDTHSSAGASHGGYHELVLFLSLLHIFLYNIFSLR